MTNKGDTKTISNEYSFENFKSEYYLTVIKQRLVFGRGLWECLKGQQQNATLFLQNSHHSL